MSEVRFSPCGLRDVALWVTASEEGLEWKERQLPLGVIPPVGAISQGRDRVFERWRFQVPVLRPLKYELISLVDRKGDLFNERYYQVGGYRRPIAIELSQHRQNSITRDLLRSEQLDGMPEAWMINSRLRRKHHSITEVQDAGVFGVGDNTIDVTLGSAITTGNTLIGCAAFASGHPDGPPVLSFALSNSAGSYTQAHINRCGAFFGHSQWMGYRVAGGSEGTQQSLVVTASNTDNSHLYVVEVSEIAASGTVDGQARTQDAIGGATSQATGTTGTLSSGEKYVVYFYSLGAGTSGGSYNGTPPTQTSALNSTYISTRVATEIVTATTGATNTYSWTTSVESTGMVVAFLGDTANPPVNTVPGDGLQFTSAQYVTIPGLSVAEGDNPITSIVFTTVGEGEGVFRANATLGIDSIAGTATPTLTVSAASATEAQWNTFLAGVQYKGAVDLQGTDLVTMTTTDGILNDVDTFEVINDPTHLLLTASGTYGQMVTAVNDTRAMLISGTTGDVTMTTTDDAAQTDVDTFMVTLQSGIEGGGELSQQHTGLYVGLGF